MVQVVFQTTKVVLVIFAAAHSRGCQDGRGGRLQGSLQNTLFKGGKISKMNLDYLPMSKQGRKGSRPISARLKCHPHIRARYSVLPIICTVRLST